MLGYRLRKIAIAGPRRSCSLIVFHCERKCEATKFPCIDNGLAVQTYVALIASTWVGMILYHSKRQRKYMQLTVKMIVKKMNDNML